MKEVRDTLVIGAPAEYLRRRVMRTLEVLLVAIVLGWLYALIFVDWRRGLYWLVTYLPFAGAVTIAMNLW